MHAWLWRQSLWVQVPVMGKCFFSGLFLFLLSSYLSLSLTCTGIILDHKVTHSGRDKIEEKINPSSAICLANAEINAMYGRKNLLRWHKFFAHLYGYLGKAVRKKYQTHGLLF